LRTSRAHPAFTILGFVLLIGLTRNSDEE